MAAMGKDPADLSLPQRIVFLIDIHPLLQHTTNPNPSIPSSDYITHIRASIRKILTFSPLSSSLFAFRLFVSSLSPVLSASKLHSCRVPQPHHFSFRRPLETLASISQTLDSIHLQAGPAAGHISLPSASLIAKFLLLLDHDYSWEPDSAGNRETLTFPPNLVLLFSPLYRDFVDLDGKNLDPDGILGDFCRIFGHVKEKFAYRDIHLSWVRVNFHGQCELGFLERGIRELGWGFCSTDAIVVGSALLPFGLIFPYVGCKMEFSSDMSINNGQAELVLGITDVSGKPLECKSCSLEVIGLNLARERPDFWALLSKKSGGAVVKIQINEVWCRDETKFTEKSAGVVLLRAFSGECKNEEGNSGSDIIMERVLELLCREKDEFIVQKPIWQLLLAFLFRRNYWASVSISDSDGNSHEGVLKPFAVNYALLSILETNISTSCRCLSKTSTCTVAYSSNTKNERRKRDKMHKHMLQGGATWNSFYNAMFRQDDDCAPEMNLEEIYFDTGNTKSKKLRFLKCWMSQMKKLTDRSQIKPNEMRVPAIVDEEVKERPDILQDQHDMCVSSSSAPETPHTVQSEREFSSFSCLEDLEAFLRSVPQKIEHGMRSKEVDLWSLSERLVGLSIDALYAKFISCKSKDSIHEEVEDVSEVHVSSEVSRLLLMKPKDLMLKHKSSISQPLTSDQCATNYSTENIIREHELQILFRMELLQSKIAASLEENVKQKIVKEICSLLQNIEFYLQGDFLSGESLLEFAGRIIKSRYAHSLGDIIHKVYSEMEFFSFDDEEMEASDSLAGSNGEEPNAEGNDDSNAAKYAWEPTAKASSSQSYAHPQENNAKGKQIIGDNVHDQRQTSAQEKRDLARRLSSSTSWVPDLHKVWVLKQPRSDKPMIEYFPNFKSKRKKREGNKNEVVCETPMTSMKHSQKQVDEDGGSDTVFRNDNSCRLLSKALFPT